MPRLGLTRTGSHKHLLFAKFLSGLVSLLRRGQNAAASLRLLSAIASVHVFFQRTYNRHR